MLASRRGDRVVALDGNPDVGSLAYRVRHETAATAADLLHDLDDITHDAQVRGYTNQATSRLEVVAAPDDPRIVTPLRGEDYLELLELLRRFHQLILVDCGPGILDPTTRPIMGVADQLD